MVTNVVCKRDAYGYIDLPAIDLMKDTNVIKVILENLDGSEMMKGDFSVEITADNSCMDYLNNVVGHTRWHIARGAPRCLLPNVKRPVPVGMRRKPLQA